MIALPSVEKLIQKMKNQPNGIRPDEADKVLRHNGFSSSRQNGSHKQYANSNGETMIIPQTSTLKRAYIADILKQIGEK